MKFERRTEAPKKDNEFYYSKKNVFVSSGYGMPNCTCYALGRYAELTGVFLPIIKGNARGNAEDWFDVIKENGKYQVSDKPQLGAVACWKCGKTLDGKDGAGHVAVVEHIEDNGDIICSNSAYNGTPWYEQTFKANKNYAWTSTKTGKKYEFQGFILPTVTFSEDAVDLHVVGSAVLRMGAGTKHRGICGLKRNMTFSFDGQSVIINNVKWLHGFVTVVNEHNVPIRYGGWVEAKYIK